MIRIQSYSRSIIAYIIELNPLNRQFPVQSDCKMENNFWFRDFGMDSQASGILSQWKLTLWNLSVDRNS